MRTDSRIYVAGHTGMVGSALCRLLRRRGCEKLILRTRAELDLTDRSAVEELFRTERPEYVFLAAAMVGGIKRNASSPAEMIHVNLAIQDNVIDLAWRHGAAKLLFIASGCTYPKHCPVPIRPEAMLTGPIEPSNEPFAVAKIAGIRMCQAYNAQYGTHFISVIPATMYGPGDHFHDGGHVISALIARFHAAKASGAPAVEIWGTGTPRREFVYVDDAAEAMALLMDACDDSEVVHIGVGESMSIADLARKIARVVGFTGEITFDTARPDGIPERLLDSGKISELGWRPRTLLDDGLAKTYAWYLQQLRSAAAVK